MNANDWTALAVGAALGLGAYAALHAAKQWLRKTIAARICPLCGCRDSTPPQRTLDNGVQQLGEQLDRQASTRATPCPACSRADQAGLAPAEQHPACVSEEHGP